MAEHTPGPWQLGHSTLYGAQGRTIMLARDFLHISPADRTLIAAAPDLLAAAEEALDWLGYDEWCTGGQCVDDACEGCQKREALRAAIAKAKGEG